MGGCPAHNGLPPVNPEDPLNPDPNGTAFPGVQEPYIPGPGESHEGYGPSPSTVPPPVTVEPEPPGTTPTEPEEPTDPNPGGGLFDDLWGIAM